MKKVLIIANQYPPMGGSGVQRSCKFVKYLREFNYEPIVLTREVSKGVLDYSLLDDVPEHEIYRTKAYDYTQWPGVLSLLGKVITRTVMIPDADYTWSVKTYKQAVEIIEQEQIDIIYSTSFPYSDHLLAAKLKERFPSLPWVVDFRDEWTKNPYIMDKNYSSYRKNKEKQMETMVINGCDQFITNTSFMLDNFLEDYQQLKTKSHVIPNGYDDSDFNSLSKEYEYKDVFRITYAGAMYGRRRPDKIFEALGNLIKTQQINKQQIQLRLIGDMNLSVIDQLVKSYGLDQVVTTEAYLPHKEAIEALVESDVLLLLIGEGKGAKNFASGKIFEYINCQRPILAVVPSEGAAANIVRETESGVICETSSVSEIESGILKLYKEWEQQSLIKEPNWEEIKKYHRRELTASLAGIFDLWS